MCGCYLKYPLNEEQVQNIKAIRAAWKCKTHKEGAFKTTKSKPRDAHRE